MLIAVSLVNTTEVIVKLRNVELSSYCEELLGHSLEKITNYSLKTGVLAESSSQTTFEVILILCTQRSYQLGNSPI